MKGLNSLSDAELRAALGGCCASARWVDQVVARRPFEDVTALLLAAEAAWAHMQDDDWAEAFAASGERQVPPADANTERAAAVALRLYRERFGHPFMASQESRSADELLMRVRIRLGNDEATELRTAREEQQRITRRRLELLVGGVGVSP